MAAIPRSTRIGSRIHLASALLWLVRLLPGIYSATWALRERAIGCSGVTHCATCRTHISWYGRLGSAFAGKDSRYLVYRVRRQSSRIHMLVKKGWRCERGKSPLHLGSTSPQAGQIGRLRRPALYISRNISLYEMTRQNNKPHNIGAFTLSIMLGDINM